MDLPPPPPGAIRYELVDTAPDRDEPVRIVREVVDLRPLPAGPGELRAEMRIVAPYGRWSYTALPVAVRVKLSTDGRAVLIENWPEVQDRVVAHLDAAAARPDPDVWLRTMAGRPDLMREFVGAGLAVRLAEIGAMAAPTPLVPGPADLGTVENRAAVSSRTRMIGSPEVRSCSVRIERTTVTRWRSPASGKDTLRSEAEVSTIDGWPLRIFSRRDTEPPAYPNQQAMTETATRLSPSPPCSAPG